MIEPFWSKILFRCLQYLFYPPYPYMPVVHLKENWRQSPSWYETNWKEMHSQSRKSGRERFEGPSSSSAAEEGASQSASAGGANYASSDSAGAKKTKTKVRYLKVCGASGTSWTGRRRAWGRRTRRARRRTIGCTSSTRRWACTLRPWRYSTRTLKRRAQKGKRPRNNSIKISMKYWKSWRPAGQDVWRPRLPTIELSRTSMRACG